MKNRTRPVRRTGFATATTIMEALLIALLFVGCSTAPKEPAPAAASAAPAPAQTSASPLIDAGFEVETATGTGVIQSVDKTTRRVVIKRADSTSASYIAGPEVANFDQLNVGDEIVATVTESCAFFVVKGGVLPGVAGADAVVRAPKGSKPGGLALSTRDYDAKVLDVDREARKVLLQYGTNDATSVKVGPTVDLTQLTVGDDVLVRATEAMAITVVKP